MAVKAKPASFADMPTSLQTLLEGEADFQKIQHMFFLFLKKIKNDIEEANRTPVKAARAFVVMKYLKAEFEQFFKEVKQVYNVQELHTIPKIFDDLEIPQLPLNEGYVVSVKPHFFCSFKPGEKEAGFEWLRSVGLGDLIKLDVNARTLTSAIQELVETQSIEPPTKHFHAYIQNMAKVTKGKVTLKGIAKDPNNIYDDLVAAE
jgi:hypothetical protein